MSDPKIPGGLQMAQMTHPSENASCNPFRIKNTLFESKLLFQGSIDLEHLSKNVKNIRSNKKINFGTESIKKPKIDYDFLFIIAIYSLQNVNKHPSTEKLVPK